VSTEFSEGDYDIRLDDKFGSTSTPKPVAPTGDAPPSS
jgi:hypothetical protein